MNTRIITPEHFTTELSVRPDEWPAHLRLKYERTPRGVRLTEKSHRGPLYTQKLFYPEGLDLPHSYLLHPPGGMVSGDVLDIHITASEQAQVLLTTPGAGRMYRARNDRKRQQQNVHLFVEKNSSLEWLPMEAILYPNANASFDNQIHLAQSSKVIYWDVMSLGLPSNQQGFEQGEVNQNVRVFQQGRLALQERFVLNNTNRKRMNGLAGLRQFSIQGFMLAGPFERDQADLVAQLREAAHQFISDKHVSIPMGITQTGDFICIRCIADLSDKVREVFSQLWAIIRPALLNRDAVAPRIWST